MSTTKQTDPRAWVRQHTLPRLGSNRVNVAKRDKDTGITHYSDGDQRMPNGDLITSDGRNLGKISKFGGLQ